METARFSETLVPANRPNYTLSFPILFIFAMPEITSYGSDVFLLYSLL